MIQKVTLSLVRLAVAFGSLFLSSCLSFVDKEYAGIEAQMKASSDRTLVVGMWHDKQQGGLSGFHSNVSKSILFRSDGTVYFRSGGNSSVFAIGGNTYETHGVWRYDSPGNWIVNLKGHPEDWYIRTDGTHLLSRSDLLGTRVRTVYIRADDEAAVRRERGR